jgi:hypothetical protein
LFGNIAIVAQLIGALPVPEGKMGSLLCASYIFPIGTLLGAFFLIALAKEVKHVTLTETHLLVCGFFTTARIDLRGVISVEESNILNLATIEVKFEYETQFGKSIQFLPAGSLFTWGPAVSSVDLRHAAARALCLHLDHDGALIPTPMPQKEIQEGIKEL